MPGLKYHDGTAWTDLATKGPAGARGPTGPTGPAADTSNLVQKSGDTMTGPLVVPAPTQITQVGRWAEGTPRFVDEAVRDTAYLTIGGAREGMHCHVESLLSDLVYDGTQWISLHGSMGACQGEVKWTGRYTLSNINPTTPWKPPWNDLTSVAAPPVRQISKSASGLTLAPDQFMLGYIGRVRIASEWTTSPADTAKTLACEVVSNNGTVVTAGIDTRYIGHIYSDTVEFVFYFSSWNGAATLNFFAQTTGLDILSIHFLIHSI